MAKDIRINQIGNLLMYKNRTGLPRIGESIRGKYIAPVNPINPIAVICIHMSYRTKLPEKNTESIDNTLPIKSNANDSFAITRVNLYLAFFHLD